MRHLEIIERNFHINEDGLVLDEHGHPFIDEDGSSNYLDTSNLISVPEFLKSNPAMKLLNKPIFSHEEDLNPLYIHASQVDAIEEYRKESLETKKFTSFRTYGGASSTDNMVSHIYLKSSWVERDNSQDSNVLN